MISTALQVFSFKQIFYLSSFEHFRITSNGISHSRIVRERNSKKCFFTNISAGTIKTTSTNINYETIGTTSFLLTAYVSDGKASASGTLTISITNKNEAPQFLLSTYTLTGNEGSVRFLTLLCLQILLKNL